MGRRLGVYAFIRLAIGRLMNLIVVYKASFTRFKCSIYAFDLYSLAVLVDMLEVIYAVSGVPGDLYYVKYL